ncbi:unnamed protein product [Rotaria magnacalcarata]|uniref:HAT C-terminal dimerisation domain-containing protein n=1 Tax=Rotaria magnacalcarata TaxID=392030 RepID=A0A816SSM7_9BILA|nr:unnamed protein product [Rotaria magnacalcarata]
MVLSIFSFYTVAKNIDAQVNSTVRSSASSTKKLNLLASCYGQVDTTETKVNVIDEFERYLKPSDSLLNDDEDLFAFWERQKHSYSILHSITCEILITPATNTAVEHLFSSSGNAVTETRSRLSAQKVNKLMFIKKILYFKKKVFGDSTTTALNIINSGITINTGEEHPYGRLSEEDGDFIYAGDSNDYEVF